MDAGKTGLLIVQARKEKELTQKDLAQTLHVSVQAVSKWERGLNFPDLSLLEPLAELLELSISELLAGERGQQPQEALVRETLHTFLLQMRKRVRRWRWLFCAALALLWMVLAGGGYLWVRDNTDWLPQRVTVVTSRAATEGETLVAHTAGGTMAELFDLTVADGVSEYQVELELWTEEGLARTWPLAWAGNCGGPRRQTLAFFSSVEKAEPLSTMTYGVAIDGVGVWNGVLDDLPYMSTGFCWATPTQPITLSPDYGAVLVCISLDPAGQRVWRTPGWAGDVDEPTVEKGAAFLLLRLRCK